MVVRYVFFVSVAVAVGFLTNCSNSKEAISEEAQYELDSLESVRQTRIDSASQIKVQNSGSSGTFSDPKKTPAKKKK